MKKKTWYLNNTLKHKQVVSEYRRRNREWLDGYKTTQGCKVCLVTNPNVLKLYWKAGPLKGKGVWKVVQHGLRRIKKEVTECDVLCASCHRRIHAAEKVSK